MNHSPGDEREDAFAYEDGDDDNFVLNSYRGAVKGTECCVSDGNLSNDLLLSNYGFALRNKAHDVVEVMLPIKVRTS